MNKSTFKLITDDTLFTDGKHYLLLDDDKGTIIHVVAELSSDDETMNLYCPDHDDIAIANCYSHYSEILH